MHGAMGNALPTTVRRPTGHEHRRQARHADAWQHAGRRWIPTSAFGSLTDLGAVRHKRSSSSWWSWSCIYVSGLCLERLLLAIMDISAPATSLADRPERAIWVTSVRGRREDRPPSQLDSLADLGGQLIVGRASIVRQLAACSPRRRGREPRHSRQCVRAC